MTPKRKKRLALIVLMITGIAVAAGFAMKDLAASIVAGVTTATEAIPTRKRP